MCLTIPKKISKISNSTAYFDDGKQADISLIDNALIGDYVLVNADLAVNKISAKEALEILDYFQKC